RPHRTRARCHRRHASVGYQAVDGRVRAHRRHAPAGLGDRANGGLLQGLIVQTNILRSVAFTAIGNAALAGRDVSALNRSKLLQFNKTIDFVVRSEDGDESVASSPVEWFGWLKAQGCAGLRLHNAPMEQRPGRVTSIPERNLVGFVGGGPRW